MEQSWTLDNDLPSGDLEFWAMRRGLLPERQSGVTRLRLRASRLLRRLRNEG